METLPRLLNAPHRVSRAVRRGAFPPGDAEPQTLVVADQAGGEALPRPGGAGVRAEAQPAAPSLPWEVVVLGPQRRGGDGVLRFHHALPQHCHGDGGAGAAQGLHRSVVLRFVQVDTVYLTDGRRSALKRLTKNPPNISDLHLQEFVSHFHPRPCRRTLLRHSGDEDSLKIQTRRMSPKLQER